MPERSPKRHSRRNAIHYSRSDPKFEFVTPNSNYELAVQAVPASKDCVSGAQVCCERINLYIVVGADGSRETVFEGALASLVPIAVGREWGRGVSLPRSTGMRGGGNV